ncbi:MAG: hydantoinase B/oxoprolinase family protein [Thalassobaculales bacterium]
MPTDPVTLEVVGNYLVSAVREMGVTLRRTAYSTIIREQHDCTTALFDASGLLIAQADHVPSHQGTLSWAAKTVARTMEMRDGDVIVLNHPYMGGTHHPDIMIFKPVFHDGELVAISGSLGHHLDVGGRSPGSVATDAKDVFEEGIMIPPLHLFRDGKVVQPILDMIAANIRLPDQTMGDIRAQIASVSVGERRYRELCAKHGVAGLRAIVADLLDTSERQIREDIARYPNGTYHAEGFMDGDGIEDVPVRIAVAVTLADGAVTVDFAGTSRQVKGPFNCSVSSVSAAAFCAVRYMASPQILQNEGCYRPITLKLPEGSVVNPVKPAPLSGRFHTMERIANTIVMAFNQARGAEAVGSTHAHLSSYSVSGRRPETGKPFILFDFLGGGWGGTAETDGLDGTLGLMANCQDAPIEVVEMEHPLRVERYELVADTGGAGLRRGGLGLRREVRYLHGEGYVTNRSDAQKFPPPGVLGGGEGAPSRQSIERTDGSIEWLPSKVTNRSIVAGEMIRMATPGGGGHGDPRARPVEWVAEDVADGKVSVAAARAVYGVAVDAAGVVDAAETARLRAP